MIQNIQNFIHFHPYQTIGILASYFLLNIFLLSLNRLLKKQLPYRLFKRIKKVLIINLITSIFLILGALVYQKVNQINLVPYNQNENTFIHQQKKFTFGIDVSHYNGKIKWETVKTSKHPIKFVFIRATMGKNGTDSKYKYNLKQAQKNGFLVGSYHYYRPNENSSKQFNNFNKHSIIQKGHLYPVLDIEEPSKYGNKNLVQGIQNWLKLAEATYGVKPIIYTGRSFYHQYLKNKIKGYPLWIASYSHKNKLQHTPWNFHQFTDKVKIKGTKGYTDGNDFNGNIKELKERYILR